MVKSVMLSGPRRMSQDELRQDRALVNLLDSLDETEKWIADLDRERSEAMGKRANMRISVESLLRSVTYAVKCRHDKRYAELCNRYQPRPRRRSGTMENVLEYLAEFDRRTVRATDIMNYLNALGIETGPKYGSQALQTLAEDEIVGKSGHGTYVVNHNHPELVEVRLARITRRRKTWGR